MQLEELLKRLEGAGGREISSLAELEEHVASGSLSKEEFMRVLDGLGNPIRDINTKVSAAALKVLLTLVSASPEYLGGAQLNSVCNVTIDRVGDMKQPVRQAACQVIQAVILTQSLPSMLERLNKAFDHKNHRVREAVLEIIKSHLHQQGLADMTNTDVSKLLLPKLVAALSDSQASVRLASQETLTVLYSQFGEPLMPMLEKHSIRPAQMRDLSSRFEKAAAVPSMAGSESSQSAASSHFAQQSRPKSGGAGRRSVAGSKLTGTASVAEEHVAAVQISSEAELMHELLTVGRELGANVDWEKRIVALKRLHGLAIADAGSYPAFADHLRANLRDTLVTQVADRRSQVCRAACNALMACALPCGQKFEHLAYSLIPELFKQLVVSIVVVADAADACMHSIVRSCHSGRILKLFTDVLLNDKSPKLRQRCAEYMHQALQEWPASAFAREQQQLMRMGVTKAIEDASAEVRLIGRSLFLTFAGVFREEVAGILKNVDPATALKLQRSLRDGETGATSSPSASHRGPFGGFSSTAASSRASSRPSASRPSRLQTASTDSLTGQRPRPPSHSPGIKSRYSTSAPGMHSDSRHDSDGHPLTIGAALSQYAAAKSPTGPLSWSIAVALFEAISHAIDFAASESDDGAGLLRPHMQQLKVALTEGLERNHTKVQVAALDAFATAFRAGCEAFEESIAALLPQVLALGSTRNQQMQAKAIALREDLGRRLPADSLIDAINSSLAVTKLWYVKTAAFELFSDHIGPSKPAGVPSDSKALSSLATEAVHHVTSSSAEVKTAAIQLLCVMHGMRPDIVARTLSAQNTTNANHEEVLQAVREAIPSIDQDLNSQLFQRTSDGTAASVSRGSVSRAGSTSSYGRDENRAPNRAEHANGAKGAVTPQTSTASSGSNGIAQMVLTDAERLKVTRERMERLLQSINDNPRHCAPALVQLRSAVRAVPDEVWLEQVQHVVSISMKLLLLMYYEVLEDACRMLMELVKARSVLLQPYMQPLVDCLLDVYNALPVEQQPSLMKHVERLMDYMAQHMDVHALMEYYIAKFPAPKTIQAGTANTSRNCLRKMAVMARYTIMRCKGDPEHERDLLELLPGLHRTMDTDCAAVRMRTTEMWVAAFSVLGSRLQPYMESLSSSQKRIINLYISRMKPSPSLVNGAATEQEAARIAAPAK